MTAPDQDISVARFEDDLASLIPQTCPAVVVHSGLMGFANRLDVPARDLIATVLESLRKVVGPERTLIMPAFYFSFPRERVFDVVCSKPDTGRLVEAFLAEPGVQRSTQPVGSYAVEGPGSETLLTRPCTTAWGTDSAQGWFYEADAQFVSLGIGTLLSCSYYHMAEEWERVPYRYFKRFTGELRRDGETVGTCEEVMYVRPLGIASDFLGTPADTLLEEKGLKRRPPKPGGVIMESISIRDIVHASQEVLRADAYAMVPPANRAALEAFVADGHLARERDALPPEQRFEDNGSR